MLRIIDECENRGHEIVVYCGEWQGPYPANVAVKVIPASGLTNHTRAAQYKRRVRRQLAADTFDAVIGFNKMPGLDIYYAADYCYLGRVIPRYRFPYRLTPRYQHFRKFERSVFGPDSNTKILCLSKREKSIYQQFHHTPDNRFAELPPTLDRRQLIDCTAHTGYRVRRELGIADNTHLILFVGSGFKTKGLDRAIRAVAGLSEDLRRDSCLLVVGQDNPKPFQRLARRLHIYEKVRFLGGRSDVPELLCAGDLLVHPAYSENTGLILLEAITAGLPLLATDVCGYAQHITASRAGRLLPSPFSQKALNQELAGMIVSDERNTWKNNGLAYRSKSELYTMPTCAVDTIERWTQEKAVDPAAPVTNRSKSTLTWRRDDFHELLAGKDNFEEIMGISGEVFREAPGRRTLRFTRNGKAYFLKAHSGVGWREILKNLLFFRLPVIGARNEWHGIHFLRRLGIDTMCIVAFGVAGRNPARRRSFIVTEEIPATINLEEYCGQWRTNPPKTRSHIRFKRWLIEKTAKIARTMHRGGANHRDLYLCHFLLKTDSPLDNPVPERTDIYVIDLHRMQLRRRTPTRWLVKDIASLYYSSMNVGLTQRDLFRFMKVYDDRPLREIFRSRNQFWRRVANRALNLYNSERRKTQTPSSSIERQAAVSTTISH
jgi:UDP-glucose:(heptosyl)LPS alpha-1,3-glucosyltransferase